MRPSRLHRHWPLGAALLGAAYACSGTANVTTRPGGIAAAANEAGDGNESGGTGGRNAGGTGGSINLGGKSGGGKGGKGGSAANGGSSAEAGNGEGGFADDTGFGGLPDVTFEYEPNMGGQGGACESVTGEATLRKRPMDVIVSIDNSASMAGEIIEVQARINDNFAQILEASEIDYRVILVSRYGNVFDSNYDGGDASDSAYSVCIGNTTGNPLSTLDCPTAEADTTPTLANNPGTFYHHSTDIGSHNMWCQLLDSYDTSDPISSNGRAGWTPVAPNGWKDFVRADAYKVFIAITDDEPTATGSLSCPGATSNLAGATAFDMALRALDPAQFQTATGERNYVWYSIVGMHGTVDVPLLPTDPVGTQCCRANGNPQTNCQGTTGSQFSDSAFPGVGYQELSIMTGGLRYPSCYTASFDSIFNKIAEGVIEGASVSCVYDVPTPDSGIVDFDQTKVSYLPSAAAAVPLSRFGSDVECASSEGFYFSPDNTKINLCPATCTTVQADIGAKVAIDFGCLGS
jgi:hypothetical protein